MEHAVSLFHKVAKNAPGRNGEIGKSAVNSGSLSMEYCLVSCSMPLKELLMIRFRKDKRDLIRLFEFPGCSASERLG